MFPGASYSVKNLLAMQETQVQSLGWEDPLEKEMVTHSSFVAWRIPWTEEPGGLQSMGSQELDMTQRLNQHSKYNVEAVKNPLGFELCLFIVCGLMLENTRTRTYCPKLQPCPVSVNVLFTIMALTSLE